MFQQVLDFWFAEIETSMWWRKDHDFDLSIQSRFGSLHQQAAQAELFSWRNTARGSLAEVLILDQFSRNIYRNKPRAFGCDALALALSQTAIDKNFDMELTQVERHFLYLPFMHSESALIHKEAVRLYTELGNAVNLDFELKHKVIIDRFGRYPHRNKVLGRESTTDEIEFLQQPGSSF